MAIRYESACTSCDWPGGCSGCSRNHDYPIVSCDECNQDISETVYVSPEGNCLCYDCAHKQFEYDEENEEWLDEDDWEVQEPYNYATDLEESAEAAYWDQKCDEERDRQLFEDDYEYYYEEDYYEEDY